MAHLPTSKISTCLWFNTNGQEAAEFYVSLIPDSRILHVMPGPTGAPLLVDFELAGQRYQALNGGPVYQLSSAVSIVLHCESQQEVDHYWAKLTEGGEAVQCGWLTDRFGLSWQVVPTRFLEMVADEDPKKVARVMDAMMQMVKFDVAKLEEAYAKG